MSLDADALLPPERARTLRRADWRFLLSPPSAALVVAKGPADLASAAAVIGGRVAELADDVTDAQLAALFNPSRDDLVRAHAVLAPGGACYAEWTGPLAGRRARRLLRDTGFGDFQTYWFWPPTRRGLPVMWLSLERRAATAHLRAAARARATRRRRAVAYGVLALWRAARRGGLVAPIATIAWKDAKGKRQPAALTDEIRRRWSAWGLGPEPRAISLVLRAYGASALNKIVFLVFVGDETTPRLSLKMARTPASDLGLRREVASMRAVVGTAAARAASVPAVVFGEEVAGTLVVGQTPVEGRPLIDLLNARNHARIAVEVADVLRAFLDDAPKAAADRWDRIVAPTIARFRARFGGVADPADIADLERDLRTLPPLAVAVEHRDCSPWNILRDTTGRLVLLDWESAEPSGFPGMDLVYFLANAAFLTEGTLGSGREPMTYIRMLDPKTRSGRIFAAAVGRYIEGTRLDTVALGALRRLAWMIHACGEFDRIAAARPHLGIRERARASLYYALWEHDARRPSARTDEHP